MARLSRGDIWIVHPVDFPKPRPAVVLSINAVNDLCPDVVVVPITTKAGPLHVPFEAPKSVTGLDRDSYAKCESITTLHKSRLKKKIGALPHGELASFENGVKRVLGLR